MSTSLADGYAYYITHEPSGGGAPHGDVLLRHALQTVADDASQVEKDLGGDARITELDVLEEALVHGEEDSWDKRPS